MINIFNQENMVSENDQNRHFMIKKKKKKKKVKVWGEKFNYSM